MTLFERIKNLANKRGLSLLQLNNKANLGKNAIYKWKKQTPSTENLQKVAAVLGVSTAYLLGEDDSLNSKPEIKHINVDDIVNNAAMLTSREHALSDSDRDAIRSLLKTYLETSEGQKRLREYGHLDDDHRE